MKKLLFILASLCTVAATSQVKADEKVQTAILGSKKVTIEKIEDSKIDSKAEMPKLTISGGATVCANFCPNDVTYYQGANPPKQTAAISLKSTDDANKDTTMSRFCAGTADILFSVIGKLENGWKYGAKMDLYAMRGETKIDKMYALFERNNIGSFFFGNVKGPEDTFLCSGQELLGGCSGFDGSVPGDMCQSTGIIGPVYMVGSTSKATKAVYYTPRIHGFQLGFAITPDTKHSGRAAKDWHAGESDNGNDKGIFRAIKGCDKPSGRNNMVFGLSHEHEFNSDWKYKVAGIYLMENTQAVNETNCYVGELSYDTDNITIKPKSTARKIKLRNASACQFTGTISYRDWSFGAGYLNNGKSRLPKASEFTDTKTNAMVIPGGFFVTKDGNSGQAWNVGVKYQINEKWSATGCYHRITRKVTSTEHANGNLLTFTVDYKVCSGLKIFTEIDHACTKGSDYACSIYNLTQDKKKAIKKQSTTAIIVGARIEF